MSKGGDNCGIQLSISHLHDQLFNGKQSDSRDPPHLVDLTTLASSWQDDGCPCAEGSETFLPADGRWADRITSDKYYALRCKTQTLSHVRVMASDSYNRCSSSCGVTAITLKLNISTAAHTAAPRCKKTGIRKCKLSCCGQNVHFLCTFLEMSGFDKENKCNKMEHAFK